MKRNIVVFLSLICTIYCNKVLQVLHKCCPSNQLVTFKKRCVNSTEFLDFSQFVIFNDEFKETDKKIYDNFVVVANRFQDTKFHNESFSFLRSDLFNLYLTEKANLFIEIPNMYDRWHEEHTGKFCFDFLKTRKSIIKPVFYILMQEKPLFKIPDNMSNENFIAHIKSHGILRNWRVADNVNFFVIMITCCFLLVVLIVYASLPELRNLSGLLLMTFVASILVALLEHNVMRVTIIHADTCFTMTLSIYFFSLASYCWMNVMAFDVWWMLRNTKVQPNYRRSEILAYGMYSLYAWSLPLALTIMLAWIDSMDLSDKPWIIKPNLIFTGCFISGGEKLLYIDVPLMILICINWIFHMMTAFNIRATSKLDSSILDTSSTYHTHQKRFYLYLKLTIMMTINWISIVMEFVVPDVRTWYLNVACNTLIGISVFLIFVYKRNIMGRFYL